MMRLTFNLLLLMAFSIGLISCKKPSEKLPELPQAVTKETENGMALLYVAGTGNLGIARNLLDQGVDVNFRGKENNTPLMEAAYAGNVEMVKFLLSRGADVSAKKHDGATPVTLSSNQEISNLFKNVTDLVATASRGDNKTLQQLIERGIPLNAVDQNGQTALSESCWNGHINTVRLLLENGADPSIKKPDGETPLTLAVARKHPDIVALLNGTTSKQPGQHSK